MSEYDSRDVQSSISLHSKCIVASGDAPCVTIEFDGDSFHQLRLFLGSPEMHVELAAAINFIARKHRSPAKADEKEPA